MDTCIEETIFSDKGSEDGGVNTVGVSRREEEAEEDKSLSLETKLGQMKKLAQREMGGQLEDNSPYPYEVRHVQGVFAGGAALSVEEKVNAIHSLIHNSLSELASCVQRVSPPLSKPDLSVGLLPKAHITSSGGLGRMKHGGRVGTEEGCVRSGSGKTSTQPVGGSETSTDASVNFFGGVNADSIDGVLHLVGVICDCVDKG